MKRQLQILSALLVTATAADSQVLQITEINDWDSPVRGTGHSPALHAGTVAFYGSEAQSSLAGVFTSPANGSGVFTTIAQQGDPVPNNPGRTFGNFDNPSIYGGTVAFTGGWGSDPDGLYLGDGGPLSVVVDYLAGQPRPRFTFLGPEGVTFASRGAYETRFFVPLPSGSPTPLAIRGMEAPGGGTFATFSVNGYGAAFGGGYAAFNGYVNHPGDVTVSLYTYEAATGELELVANWDTPIPGQGVDFEYIGNHDTDGATVAFEGSHGNVFFGGFTGVYTTPVGARGNGPLTIVAEMGQPAPGSGVPFQTFGSVAVEDDLVVFEAWLDSTTEPNHGLFGCRDGQLFKIIDNGDPLFEEDTIDFRLSNRGLDHNQLAFRARWVDPNGPFGHGYGVYVATLAGGITLTGPTSLAPGATLDLDVVGAEPGERVYWFYSLRGMGYGLTLRGATADLLGPLSVLGSVVADAQGEATFPLSIPANAPLGIEVGIQTAVLRGTTESITSNALATRIE